jgi:hypothetical protein
MFAETETDGTTKIVPPWDERGVEHVVQVVAEYGDDFEEFDDDDFDDEFDDDFEEEEDDFDYGNPELDEDIDDGSDSKSTDGGNADDSDN